MSAEDADESKLKNFRKMFSDYTKEKPRLPPVNATTSDSSTQLSSGSSTKADSSGSSKSPAFNDGLHDAVPMVDQVKMENGPAGVWKIAEAKDEAKEDEEEFENDANNGIMAHTKLKKRELQWIEKEAKTQRSIRQNKPASPHLTVAKTEEPAGKTKEATSATVTPSAKSGESKGKKESEKRSVSKAKHDPSSYAKSRYEAPPPPDKKVAEKNSKTKGPEAPPPPAAAAAAGNNFSTFAAATTTGLAKVGTFFATPLTALPFAGSNKGGSKRKDHKDHGSQKKKISTSRTRGSKSGEATSKSRKKHQRQRTMSEETTMATTDKTTADPEEALKTAKKKSSASRQKKPEKPVEHEVDKTAADEDDVKTDTHAGSNEIDTNSPEFKTAIRLMNLLKRNNMLENALFPAQNETVRRFFESGMQNPDRKIMELISKALDYVMDAVFFKGEELDCLIDDQLKHFMTYRSKSKPILLDVIISRPEFLPQSWGGRTVVLRAAEATVHVQPERKGVKH